MQRVRKRAGETVMMYNAGDKEISIFTSDNSVIRKLDSLVVDYPDYYKCTAEYNGERCYVVPKNFFKIQRPF